MVPFDFDNYLMSPLDDFTSEDQFERIYRHLQRIEVEDESDEVKLRRLFQVTLHLVEIKVAELNVSMEEIGELARKGVARENELIAQIDELEQRLEFKSGLGSDEGRLMDEFTVMEKHNASLQQLLSDKGEQLVKQQQKMEVMLCEIEKLTTDKKMLNEEILQLRENAVYLHQQVDKLGAQVERPTVDNEIYMKMREKNGIIYRLLEKIKVIDQENLNLHNTTEDISGKLAEAVCQMEKATQEQLQLMENLEATKKALEEMTKERDMYKAEVEGYQNAFKQSDQDLVMAVVAKHIEEWKELVDSKDQEICNLQATICRLKNEATLSTMEGRDSGCMAKTRAKLKEKDCQLEALKKELGIATQDIKDNLRVIEDLQCELRTLQQNTPDPEYVLKLERQLGEERERVSQLRSLLCMTEEDNASRASENTQLLANVVRYEEESYGMQDAITEIKQLKSQLRLRDKQVEALTCESNQLEMAYRKLLEIEEIELKKANIPRKQFPPARTYPECRPLSKETATQSDCVIEDASNRKVWQAQLADISTQLSKLQQQTSCLHDQNRHLEEENGELLLGLQDILRTLRDKPGAQRLEALLPAVEKLLNSVEVRKCCGSYDNALLFKSEVDHLRGQNLELRNECESLREVLAGMKKETEKVQPKSGQSDSSSFLLMAPCAASASPDYILLNAQFLQLFKEFTELQDHLKKSEAGLKNHASDLAVARHQLGLLYREHAEKKAEWKAERDGHQKHREELEEQIALDRIKIEELEKALQSEAAEETLGDYARKVLLLRCNELKLTRRYQAAVDLRMADSAERERLRRQLIESEANAMKTISFLKRLKEESEDRCCEVERELQSAVPRDQHRSLSVRFRELSTQHAKLVECHNNMLAKEAALAVREAEIKLLEDDVLYLKKELKTEKEKCCLLQMQVSKTEPRSEQEASEAGKVAALELTVLNERQRADHAAHLQQVAEQAAARWEARAGQLEASLESLGTLHRSLQAKEAELRDRLAESADQAELAELTAQLKSCREAERELRHHNAILKETAEVARFQAQASIVAREVEIERREALVRQLEELETLTDERLVIGRLTQENLMHKTSVIELQAEVNRCHAKMVELQVEAFAWEERCQALRAEKHDELQQVLHRLQRVVRAVDGLRDHQAGCTPLHTLTAISAQLAEAIKDRREAEREAREEKERRNQAETEAATLKLRLHGPDKSSDLEVVRLNELRSRRWAEKLSEDLTHTERKLNKAEQRIGELESLLVQLESDLTSLRVQELDRCCQQEPILITVEKPPKDESKKPPEVEKPSNDTLKKPEKAPKSTTSFQHTSLPPATTVSKNVPRSRSESPCRGKPENDGRNWPCSPSPGQRKKPTVQERTRRSIERRVSQLRGSPPPMDKRPGRAPTPTPTSPRRREPSAEPRRKPDKNVDKQTSTEEAIYSIERESELQAKEDELQALRSEVSTLKSEALSGDSTALRVCQTSLAGLRARLEHKNVTLVRYEELLRQAQEELENERDRHMQEVRELRAQVCTVSQRPVLIPEEPLKTPYREHELMAKEVEIQRLNSKIQDLEQEIVEVNNEAQKSLQLLTSQHEAAEREQRSQLKKTEAELASCRNQVQHFQAQVENLQAGYSAQTMVKMLKHQLDDKEDQLQMLNASLTQLRVDMTETVEESRAAQKESETEHQARVAQMERQMREMEVQLKELEINRAKIRRQLKETKENEIRFQGELTRCQNNLERQNTKVSKLEQEKEELLKKVEKLQSSLRQMTADSQELERLRKTCHQLEEQISNVPEKPYDQQLQPEESRSKEEVIRWDEAKKHQAYIKRLRQRLDEATQEIKKLQTTNKRYQEQVERADRERTQVEARLRSRQLRSPEGSPLRRLKERNDKLVDEVTLLKRQLAVRLASEAAQLQAQNRVLKCRCETLQRKVAALELQLGTRSHGSIRSISPSSTPGHATPIRRKGRHVDDEKEAPYVDLEVLLPKFRDLVSQLESHISVLRDKLEVLQTSLSESESTSEIQSAINFLNKVVDKLQQEAENLKERLRIFKEKKKEEGRESPIDTKKHDLLKKALLENAKWISQIKKLQLAKDHLSHRLESQGSQLYSLQEDNQRLTKDLDAARRALPHPVTMPAREYHDFQAQWQASTHIQKLEEEVYQMKSRISSLQFQLSQAAYREERLRNGLDIDDDDPPKSKADSGESREEQLLRENAKLRLDRRCLRMELAEVKKKLEEKVAECQRAKDELQDCLAEKERMIKEEKRLTTRLSELAALVGVESV